MTKPSYAADFSEGKKALKTFFEASSTQGFHFFPHTDFAGFLGMVRAEPLTSRFTENLGFYIRTFKESGTLKEDEIKDALTNAATEVKGVWHKRFSSQDIVNSLIEEAKSFKSRFLLPWEWGEQAEIPIFGEVYKAITSVAAGAVAAVKTTGTLFKVLPFVALGLGTLVAYKYMMAPKKAVSRLA